MSAYSWFTEGWPIKLWMAGGLLIFAIAMLTRGRWIAALVVAVLGLVSGAVLWTVHIAAGNLRAYFDYAGSSQDSEVMWGKPTMFFCSVLLFALALFLIGIAWIQWYDDELRVFTVGLLGTALLLGRTAVMASVVMPDRNETIFFPHWLINMTNLIGQGLIMVTVVRFYKHNRALKT